MEWLFLNLRIASANFPAGHFSHVFIDESGQATEPEALIAFAGILDNPRVAPHGGHLVLAGDPQQLGPVLLSPLAGSSGLGESPPSDSTSFFDL